MEGFDVLMKDQFVSDDMRVDGKGRGWQEAEVAVIELRLKAEACTKLIDTGVLTVLNCFLPPEPPSPARPSHGHALLAPHPSPLMFLSLISFTALWCSFVSLTLSPCIKTKTLP